MKLWHYILLPALLLGSCTDDFAPTDGSLQRLSITFDEEQPLARSYWNDRTDDATQPKVSYVWENGDNMLTAIRHEGSYVPFYETLSSAAQYQSKTQFETVDAERSKIKLQTTCGVKYGVENNAYVYPVAAGDDMYCFHPTHGSTVVNSNATDFSVDMPLPATFSFNQLNNDLSSLADYAYVYTATTLKSVNDNSVVAHTSHFRSACAIIRFDITNNTTSDITLSRIRMEADDGTPIFPDKLRFCDGTVAEQSDHSAYYNRLTTTLPSLPIPRTQTGTFYNLCFPLDADFNHVPLRFTIDTNYLTYQLRLDTDVLSSQKFEAGKIYTFRFSLEEKEIHLNTIEVAQCTTYNIDNSESVEIVVTPGITWQQSNNVTAQMVFVSLGMSMTFDGKEYDVLWATCNLGAKDALETGFLYAWGEVKRKPDTQYSPEGYTGTATDNIAFTQHDAVRQALGDGHWFWMTPTREMWDKLDTECTWRWKPVKKVGESASEENLDFDASVWEVQKLDEGGNVTGTIYLPITGYAGWDESTGSYKKVNKARCCYWTSTPCTSDAGANATSYAFYTTYEIDPENPSLGQMSTPSLKGCERYNGYAIRPVLLRLKPTNP